MEVLCQSDYQDIYRIKDGVLLVINKFKYMSFENDEHPNVYAVNDRKRIYKKYKKGCQDALVELTISYTNKYRDWTIPEGTVLYHKHPVELVNKSEWEYQIKTTADLFGGNQSQIIELLQLIEKVIKEGVINVQEDSRSD